MSKFHSMLLTAAALTAMTTALAAQQGKRAGVLTCKPSASAALVVGSDGSDQKLSCIFAPDNGKPPEHYSGTINWLELNTNGPPGIVPWAVFAHSTGIVPHGAMAGNYARDPADVARGVGGSNILVGGSNNSFALHPLSISGKVASLKLYSSH